MEQHQHLTWPEIFWLFLREDSGAWLLTLPLANIRNCAGCREQVGELEEMLEAGELGEDTDYFDLVLARSRRRALRVWQRLEGMETKWMRRHLARAPALWGLVELLVEESRLQAAQDRDRALALAEMAVEMAERLPARPADDDSLVGPDEEEPLGLAERAEALSLAHGVLGNAYRVRDEIHKAARQFVIAEGYLLDVKAGGLFQGRVRVLSFKGSLLTDTRRLREAAVVLEEALVAARELEPAPEDLLVALSLQLANVLGLLGDTSAAIQLLTSTIQNSEAASPRLQHFLRNKLALEFVRAGKVAAAEHLLPEIRGFAEQDDIRVHASRISWLEGRIALANGKAREALAIFTDLQQMYIGQECAFESALLAFEIAMTHHQIGDLDEMRSSAEQALALLLPLEVATEALGALTLLARLARKRTVDRQTLLALIRWAEGGPDDLPSELMVGL